MWEYTDKVKDHFLNPHNVGEIENPDGEAEVGEPGGVWVKVSGATLHAARRSD